MAAVEMRVVDRSVPLDSDVAVTRSSLRRTKVATRKLSSQQGRHKGALHLPPGEYLPALVREGHGRTWAGMKRKSFAMRTLFVTWPVIKAVVLLIGSKGNRRSLWPSRSP